MSDQDRWRSPPVSATLNDQIAQAILLCTDGGQTEAALLLTRGDCLAIDYCVSQNAKSAAGHPVGREVLLKSYRARGEIEQGGLLTAEEPANQPTKAQIDKALRTEKPNGEGEE